MFHFSKRSLKNLQGVHPDLIAVVNGAIQITPVDFVVTEGVRTLDRQKQLLSAGATRTLNSRHLTGHAVDVAAWVDEVRWDWTLYVFINIAIQKSARKLGIQIEWGGDWAKFKDGCHFQLSWDKYPPKTKDR
jgi:peptidoglycan LD-endopeptidase CwlK